MPEARKNIFLVDDEIINLKMGKNALSDFYNVFALDSGESMLELLDVVLPDLILLDVNMPDMNGYEAIRQVKENERTAGIPVIFLTSINEKEMELKGLSMGAVDYITKPFSALLLLKRIEIHLLLESQKRELRFFNDNLVAENAALDGLSRMKTEFLGNLSHEIKTPLTVILSDIQRIGREVCKHGFENERVSESINRAHDEIMRMARLTDSAIKMAAMQEYHGKMDLINAASLFRTGAEGYRSIIEKQGNVLIINAEENLPRVYGSADQLIGVLSNLLTNANNHTSNGQLIVSIEEKAPFVSVTVKDTGTGIPPEMLPNIFNRGVSGSGSTGMGLPICKNIVDSHGGAIYIKSEPGKGTAVTFTMPVYSEERPVNNEE
ncbi:MAG: hybrid sensor histidine kinase/response regulator [Defluviitaleaceae bacterium]|nr:hybrid sensor histidine kinase/response regulator [Defluviitaleaceae bacterium]